MFIMEHFEDSLHKPETFQKFDLMVTVTAVLQALSPSKELWASITGLQTLEVI